MNKMMTWVGTALIASAVVVSANELTIKIPSLTSGKCDITLVDAEGIMPMAGANLKLQHAKDGSQAVSTTTDKAGKCVVKLEDGRYILSVDDKNITLVDAAKDGQMAWCRIVVSEKPMLVGGQGGEVVVSGGGLFGLGTAGTVVVGAAGTVLTVGGVNYAVRDIDGDDYTVEVIDDETGDVSVVTVTVVSR